MWTAVSPDRIQRWFASHSFRTQKQLIDLLFYIFSTFRPHRSYPNKNNTLLCVLYVSFVLCCCFCCTVFGVCEHVIMNKNDWRKSISSFAGIWRSLVVKVMTMSSSLGYQLLYAYALAYKLVWHAGTLVNFYYWCLFVTFFVTANIYSGRHIC